MRFTLTAFKHVPKMDATSRAMTLDPLIDSDTAAVHDHEFSEDKVAPTNA